MKRQVRKREERHALKQIQRANRRKMPGRKGKSSWSWEEHGQPSLLHESDCSGMGVSRPTTLSNMMRSDDMLTTQIPDHSKLSVQALALTLANTYKASIFGARLLAPFPRPGGGNGVLLVSSMSTLHFYSQPLLGNWACHSGFACVHKNVEYEEREDEFDSNERLRESDKYKQRSHRSSFAVDIRSKQWLSDLNEYQ
eukprot:g3956.t1